jgi:hypothetical protein
MIERLLQRALLTQSLERHRFAEGFTAKRARS